MYGVLCSLLYRVRINFLCTTLSYRRAYNISCIQSNESVLIIPAYTFIYIYFEIGSIILLQFILPFMALNNDGVGIALMLVHCNAQSLIYLKFILP